MRSKHLFAPVIVAVTCTGLLAATTGCNRQAGPEQAPPQRIEAPPSIQVAEQNAPAVIKLDSAQARELNIRTVRIRPDNFAYTLEITGTVEPAPENLSLVSAPLSGRVVGVLVHEGDPVRRGQPLLDLESLAFANLVADYLQAVAEETYQKSQVDRIQTLVEREINPRSTLEKARADLARSSALVNAGFARLRAVGISEAQITRWTSSKERPLLRVYAPINGVVSEHLIDMGQSVSESQHMLTLVNLSRVLVKGFASPEDAGLLTPGAPVRIEREGAPEQAIAARINSVNPSVDANNRSVTINVLAPTQGGWPMPGQNVRLQLQVRTPSPVVTIPLSAIQYEGDRATVFVRQSLLVFEKRYIEVRKITSQDVIVQSGLRGGEDVATSQVFSLKALGRFEQYAEE